MIAEHRYGKYQNNTKLHYGGGGSGLTDKVRKEVIANN